FEVLRQKWPHDHRGEEQDPLGPILIDILIDVLYRSEPNIFPNQVNTIPVVDRQVVQILAIARVTLDPNLLPYSLAFDLDNDRSSLITEKRQQGQALCPGDDCAPLNADDLVVDF